VATGKVYRRDAYRHLMTLIMVAGTVDVLRALRRRQVEDQLALGDA